MPSLDEISRQLVELIMMAGGHEGMNELMDTLGLDSKELAHFVMENLFSLPITEEQRPAVGGMLAKVFMTGYQKGRLHGVVQSNSEAL